MAQQAIRQGRVPQVLCARTRAQCLAGPPALRLPLARCAGTSRCAPPGWFTFQGSRDYSWGALLHKEEGSLPRACSVRRKRTETFCWVSTLLTYACEVLVCSEESRNLLKVTEPGSGRMEIKRQTLFQVQHFPWLPSHSYLFFGDNPPYHH